MKGMTTRFVMAGAVAAVACAARADVPPEEFGVHLSPAIWTILCVLPLVGALCLYRVFRGNRKQVKCLAS